MTFHKYILTALLACPLSLAAQNAPEANWASKNIQFAENLRPHTGTCTDTTMYAWRGERLGVQAVIYAPKQTGKLMLRLSELRAGKKVIPAKNTSARFVDATLRPMAFKTVAFIRNTWLLIRCPT